MMSRADSGRGTALVFTTISRPDCAKRLVETALEHHPDLSIYVVEQADGAGDLAQFSLARGARHILLPFDAGVGAARNAGVAAIRESFFIMADDDFVIERPLPIGKARRFLTAHPEFAMLGGDLDEPFRSAATRAAITSQRGRNIAIDQTGSGIILISAQFIGTPVIEFERETIYPCDMVAQWGLCSTAKFQRTPLRWDERYKTGGEHIDFFLTLKLGAGEVKFAYWPGFRCLHVQSRDDPAYAELRNRADWRQQFREKWGLSYQLNVGGGLRRFDETYDTARVPERPRRTGGGVKPKTPAPLPRFFGTARPPSPFRDMKCKFVLACTSRSGSDLLSKGLENCGARIDEFFNAHRVLEFVPEPGDDFNEYVRRVAQGAEVFGIKGAANVERTLTHFGEFPEHLGEWKFIYLSRARVLPQAISLEIATQSGAWRGDRLSPEAQAALTYSRDGIDRSIRQIRQVNAAWKRFFRKYRLQPFELTYETLISDIPKHVRAVAAYLGLDSSAVPDAVLEKAAASQRTTLNRDWERRYVQEKNGIAPRAKTSRSGTVSRRRKI